MLEETGGGNQLQRAFGHVAAAVQAKLHREQSCDQESKCCRAHMYKVSTLYSKQLWICPNSVSQLAGLACFAGPGSQHVLLVSLEIMFYTCSRV